MIHEVEEVGVVAEGGLNVIVPEIEAEASYGIGIDDDGGGMEAPIKGVKLGDERVGEEEVVMYESAIGISFALGDTPTQGLGGTGQDFGLAGAVLDFDLGGGRTITEAPGVDDGKEAVADLALGGGGELDGDDFAGEGFVEQSPETFTHAGGVHDNVEGVPGFGEGFELTKDGEVVLAGPFNPVKDAVGGVIEGGDGGGVNLGNGKGCGITGGIGEAGGRVGHDGFVLTSEVNEESDPPVVLPRLIGPPPTPPKISDFRGSFKR